MNKKSLILPLLVATALAGQAKVQLAKIWGDNMVLQQNAQVVFRGTAAPQKTVEVTTSWDHATYECRSDRSGNFTVTVPTASAGGPYDITFTDGETLTLNNVLLGEVWFCSGQSNMEMPVKGFRGQPTANCLEHIANADPATPVRLFTVEHAWSTTEQTNSVKGQWSEQNPETVANFSAVAYFFGERLQRTLNVPVGLINCSWSMSNIQAWMAESSIKKFPAIQLPNKKQTHFDWEAGTPTLLYNAMVNPWQGFPVRGVIWYQGEANTPAPGQYSALFGEMARQWRELFHNPTMPFYYVQLAPFHSLLPEEDWPGLRQAQLDILNTVPNVGMATTGDCGDEKFIHTPHKVKIGQRLAYLALQNTYGRKGFNAQGPIYSSCKLDGDSVLVDFSGAADGLTPEIQLVDGFELVNAQGKVVPAKAEIVRGTSTVKVWADGVKAPTEVRYCYKDFYKGQLANNFGVPASPFRAKVGDSKAAKR